MNLNGIFRPMFLVHSGWIYTCVVLEAAIKKSKSFIEEIKGVHAAGKSNSDVESFLLFGDIEEIPKGLNVIFRNLTQLSICKSGLKSVRRQDLVGYEHLESFSCESNQLQSLPDNLFEGMNKLKIISFRDNKLEHISVKLFDPIIRNGLIRVDFRNNAKIDAAFGCRGGIKLEELIMIIIEQCKVPPEQKKDPEQLRNDNLKGLVNLLNAGLLTDFTINVGTKSFRVYKSTLEIHSSAAEKNVAEDSPMIDDLSEVAVKQFIDFIYTGGMTDEPRTTELYEIAGKFEIPHLKAHCEELLLQKLNETNAFDIYLKAHLHNSPDLKKMAFNELLKMFPDLMGLKDEMMENPGKVAELVKVKIKQEQKEKELAVKSENLESN